MMAIVMMLSIAACGGADNQEGEETNTTPGVNSTEETEWPYENVTREHIQAISDVLAELEPLYNQAAALAIENGWEADETTVQELNTVYALIDAGKHGVEDPSEYGEISKENMDAVVEQYQVILGAMPDLVTKVSETYEQ